MSDGRAASAADETRGGARNRSATARTGRRTKRNPPTPSVTVHRRAEAQGILGNEVRSAPNENMGRIVDVIVDREGACAPR